MDRLGDWRAVTRGTVLVASTNPLFADIVGQMVLDSGFTPAYPVALEPAWFSVTRTRPHIAICDCDPPVASIQHLMTELAARRIPLLLSEPRGEHHLARLLTLAHRIAWLTFPVSLDTFTGMLDALHPAATHPLLRVAAREGLRIDGGRIWRTAPIVPRRVVRREDRVVIRNGHTDALDNSRADDDGMALLGFGQGRALPIE